MNQAYTFLKDFPNLYYRLFNSPWRLHIGTFWKLLSISPFSLKRLITLRVYIGINENYNP